MKLEHNRKDQSRGSAKNGGESAMRDAGTTTTYGSGDSTTAALSPASSVTSRLRATLAEVLDEFEREQRQAGDGPGLQTYQVCCSRLVTYMATRMETSPRFALQMQQVILASFSDAELPSLGLGDLWARYPTGSSAGSWNADNRNVGCRKKPPSRRTRPTTELSPSHRWRLRAHLLVRRGRRAPRTLT